MLRGGYGRAVSFTRTAVKWSVLAICLARRLVLGIASGWRWPPALLTRSAELARCLKRTIWFGRLPKKARRKPGLTKPKAILGFVERGGAIVSVVLDHRGSRAGLIEHLHRDRRMVMGKAQALKNLLPVGQHKSVNRSKFEWRASTCIPTHWWDFLRVQARSNRDVPAPRKETSAAIHG